MDSVIASPAQGLPPGISTFDLNVTRHAMDALRQRGLTMLDVVDALRAPSAQVRQDATSGHYVIRSGLTRIVVDVDPVDQAVNVITVAGSE